MTSRCTIALAAAALLAACGGKSSGTAESAPPDTSSSPAAAATADTGAEQIDTGDQGLMPEKLLRDVIAYQLCSKLGGTLQGLTSGKGEQKVVQGRLWLQQCQASVDGEVLAINLGGRGYRWISREKSKLGATFEVDQYVRFEVQFGARFDVEAEYARDDNMLIVWLRPREVTNVDLQTIGDIDVKKGMWGDVLGTVSDIWGGDPEDKASDSVEQKGESRFMQALGEGYTVALDLCTGASFTERDLLDLEAVVNRPEKLKDDEATVRIFAGGIDAIGPVDDAPIAFDLTAQSGNARASLYCEGDAAMILNAYFQGQELPTPEPLAEGYVSGTKPTRLAATDATCPVYMIVQPTDGAGGALMYKYSAYDRPTMPRPFINCEK